MEGVCTKAVYCITMQATVLCKGSKASEIVFFLLQFINKKPWPGAVIYTLDTMGQIL